MKKTILNFVCVATIFYTNIFFSKSPEKISLITSYHQEQLIYPLLVNKFYQLNSAKLFWFGADNDSGTLRKELLKAIDTSFFYGLLSEAYHYKALKKWVKNIPADSLELAEADRLYTDAAIATIKDIFQGFKTQPWVGYDEVSQKENVFSDDSLLNMLLNIRSADELSNMIASLEPGDNVYRILKEELKIQKEKNNEVKARQLIISMNYYRWIHHFNSNKFIVVNIPSAELGYYENDSLLLSMKVVLGKPSTPTPRFSSYCNQVIFYPYWNVPRKIAINELLPQIKAKPSLLDDLSMQVIDEQGRVVDHNKLNWSAFNSKYFPYNLRQCTGCDNALGVIKFNITSPYGAYLHDTNFKKAFLSVYRYYSHGCIRIEKPLELGTYLLKSKLDTTFLQSCLKDEKPEIIKVEEPVPVFVVYMLAETDTAGKVRYYKDIYRQMKQVKS